ncbi:MAG: arylsulfotransferase family protein, partial [Paracoccaceae bacterium]|nr:arylsulfotransferase family protein [Paracoccaceae bacterium]
DNDLLGLIYLSNNEPTGTEVSGDISHFNDLDIFPEGMKSDVFAPGDIMVSLRNMNTVLVLDGNDLSLKFQATGGFLRQHDPDFAGGNKITLMDNRNTFPEKKDEDPGSRILMLDAKTGEQSVIYERSGDDDFFTPIMGKHQMLGNGNILITSSLEGRAFEVSPKGEILWQVNNPAGKEFMGVISEAAILPVEMDAAFFQNARAACSG